MTDLPSPPLEPDEALLLTQLLCTRLCHDLAGPVGAVAAGVELAGTDPSQIDAETLGLIAGSSASASRKLKFFRGAFGMPAAAASVGNLQALVEGYLEATAGRGGAPKLKWASAEDMKLVAECVGGLCTPLVLNLCLLVVEALPVCQHLHLSVAAGSTVRITVQGHGEPQRAAAWRPDILDTVAPQPAMALSVKTIQVRLAQRLTARAGGRLTLEAASPILTAVFEKSLHAA